jgi:hypothetical protein
MSAFNHTLRGPDWRWQEATARFAESRLASHTDPYIRDAIRSLAARRKGPAPPAACPHGHIDRAERLWNKTFFRQALMVLTLANVGREEVAAKLDTDVQTIETIEALFFDVRPHLDSTMWIQMHVIGPCAQAEPDLAAKLQVALFSGPIAALALVDSVRLPSEEAEGLLQQRVLLYAKFKEAINFAFTTNDQAYCYLKLYLDYCHKSRELDLKEREFRHRCEIQLRAAQTQTEPPRCHTDDDAQAPINQSRNHVAKRVA